MSKNMTTSVSLYKNAFVYENPAVIEQLLSSVSGAQLYTDELASQMIEINSRYLDGSLTLDEAYEAPVSFTTNREIQPLSVLNTFTYSKM